MPSWKQMVLIILQVFLFMKKEDMMRIEAADYKISHFGYCSQIIFSFCFNFD